MSRRGERSVTIGDQLKEAWEEQLARAARTPWMLQVLLSHGPQVTSRFAYHYLELRRLPRRLRRTLWRRRAVSLATTAFLLALAGPEVCWGGTTFSVSTGHELEIAVSLANLQSGSYSGTNTIELQDTVYVTSALDITSTLVIDGIKANAIVGDASLEDSIFVVADGGDLTLEKTVVTGGAGDNGGAIYNQGTVTLYLSTLYDNTATSDGGAIHNSGKLYVTESSVSENTAGDDGGGIFNNGGTVTISDGYFESNSAGGGGGGIYSTSGTLSIADNTIFLFNSASGQGGAIYNLNGAATISDSIVSFNTASSGGGIKHADSVEDATVTISNSTVSGNSAADDGGGLHVGGAAGGSFAIAYATVTVTDSTVSDNSADNGGGVHVDWGGTATISDSTVSGNSAAGGGGLYLRHGTQGYALFVIKDDDYSLPGGRATIKYSTFSGNTASGGGGGVHASRYTTVNITNSTLSGNSAGDYGGALKTSGSGDTDRAHVTCSNCTITGNSADKQGGGIYMHKYADLTLSNTIVSGNHATKGDDNLRTHSDSSNINLDSNNLFGYSGTSGVGGSASPGSTDIVPSVALDNILSTTLADNGGSTKTHALVSGSPAINAAGTSCPAPDLDQRGYGRPASGNTVCDIGALEYGATSATADTVSTSGSTSVGSKINHKHVFKHHHDVDLTNAVLRVEKLVEEEHPGFELSSVKEGVEIGVRPGARSNKGIFRFEAPHGAKGKLKVRVKNGLIRTKLKLKKLEIAHPRGCDDGSTPVRTRLILRSKVHPSVVLEVNEEWACKFGKDGTVRKLELNQ